ncbi:MAG: radical SAM protein [Candidatus Lokiarchaeota archaeon]|nr:radical SAM protein [Candidatus Lokiarchaeota archaeon]
MTYLQEQQRNLPGFDEKTKVTKIEGYLNQMRIFVNGRCNHRCRYPNGIMWCHSRTEMAGEKGDMRKKNWIMLLDGMKRWRMSSLKIAGMEPTIHPHLLDLLDLTQSYKIDDFSITTNGSRLERFLPYLIERGMTQITVSLHSMDPIIFKNITGGSIRPIWEALDVCSEHDIKVKLNVVALKNLNDDISALLDYASLKEFELKLYQLLWQPHNTREYQKYHIDWREIIQPYVCDWKGLELIEYVDSQRYRYSFETETGSIVTVNGFDRKDSSKYHLCRTCQYRNRCEEGLMGFGFETEYNLKLNPCYLRPEFNFDLKPFLREEFEKVIGYLNAITSKGGNL